MAQRSLDVFRLLAAARGVSSRHLALRKRQVDIYTRTSTLGKSARAETDRLYDALKAAAALAERLAEDAPQWAVNTRAGTPSLKPQPQPQTVHNKSFDHALTPDHIPGTVAGAAEPTDVEQQINSDTTSRGEELAEAGVLQADELAVDGSSKQDRFRDINSDVFYDKENQPNTDGVKFSAHNEEIPLEAPTQETDAPADVPAGSPPDAQAGTTFRMSSSTVPSGRMSRLFHYSQLASSLALGAVGESIRRATGSASSGSVLLNPANLERLVKKLSRMRGAALKLGQMLSFQDSKMLPPAIQEVLQRVQDSADFMPATQRDEVLRANLGDNWRDLYSNFEETPIAAASIGQVHRAVLYNGQKVAVKIQYPGVANSIDSDLNNLSVLLNASRLLPKGLFLDKTIANARVELGWECDYIREAEAAKRFKKLLKGDAAFNVPETFDEASGKQVLTMEYMPGKAVVKIPGLTQEQRDWVGSQLLRLTFMEMAQWNFMQSDPNWTNYLFHNNRISLLDFGASRDYPESFITPYLDLLKAASVSDTTAIESLSRELGYLAPEDSALMVKTHIASILALATPFSTSAPELFDFGLEGITITEKVRALIPVMLRERKRSPPEETYSLHRKLSGAFLLLARLGSRVRVRSLFEQGLQKPMLSKD